MNNKYHLGRLFSAKIRSEKRRRRALARSKSNDAAIELMEDRVLLSGTSAVAPAELETAFSFGGGNDEYAQRAISDDDGNIYTVGTFEGTADFDPGPGTVELTGPGGIYSLFLSKHDDEGNLLWAKHIGYQNQLSFSPMRIDDDGNLLMTGWFRGTVDFDPGPGTAEYTSNGSDDCFVAKMDADGNLQWAVAIGSWYGDRSYSLQSDSNGDIYVGGRFGQTVDFDPGPGTHLMSSNGDNDLFLLKLNGNGEFVWSRGIGSTEDDRVYHVEVDSAGAVYATGHFMETVDFDPGPGEHLLTSAGNSDIFVSKYDVDGNLVWVKAFAGTGDNDGEGIAVDDFGNVYTAGYFEGTVDFDPGAGLHHLTSNGDFDLFVSKLDANGNFVWAQHVGGAERDENGNVELDEHGNVYSFGWFKGVVDFDPSGNVFELDSGAERDRHVFALNNDGKFLYATKLIDDDTARFDSTHLTANGDILVVGGFMANADFDSGPGVVNLNNAGGDDAFVAIYHQPNYLNLDLFHAHVSVLTGTTALNSGTFRVNANSDVTVTASIGEITQNNNGTFNWSYAPGPGDDGITIVTITATGTNGVETSVDFELEVNPAETFDGGTAPQFSPASPQKWSVVDGHYIVDSTGSVSPQTSTVDFTGEIFGSFELMAKLRSMGGLNEWNTGFLIFDYKNENDFKYAGMFAGQNQWVIGHYQGNWGNRFAVVDWDDSGQKILAGKDYQLHVHIEGNHVKLLVDGLPVASAWFEGNVQGGKVGLAATNSVTFFDHFQVAEKVQSGTPMSLPIYEDFEDGEADQFFFPLQDNWAVVNTDESHIFRINNSINQQLGIAYMPLPQELPPAFEMSARIKSIETGSSWHDGFLIFDYKSENDFKYAGMFAGQNKWVIGHYEGDWSNRLAEVDWDDIGKDIKTNQFYTTHIRIQNNTVWLSVDGQYITGVNFGVPVNGGAVGLAADRAFTWFDNFKVDEKVDAGAPSDLPYYEDFNDGVFNESEYHQPQLWSVGGPANDMYLEVDAAGNQGTGIGLLNNDWPLPNKFEFAGQLKTISGPDRWLDGFLVFDYHGPNDFKYAGMFAGQNQWVIGHFQGNWSNRVAEVDWDDVGQSIDADTLYQLHLYINGDHVGLSVNGQFIAEAHFEDGIHNGTVGVAAHNAVTQFDNLMIDKELTSPLLSPSADALFAGWSDESADVLG